MVLLLVAIDKVLDLLTAGRWSRYQGDKSYPYIRVQRSPNEKRNE